MDDLKVLVAHIPKIWLEEAEFELDKINEQDKSSSEKIIAWLERKGIKRKY